MNNGTLEIKILNQVLECQGNYIFCDFQALKECLGLCKNSTSVCIRQFEHNILVNTIQKLKDVGLIYGLTKNGKTKYIVSIEGRKLFSEIESDLFSENSINKVKEKLKNT